MKKEISSGFYYAHISAGRGCYGNCSFCSMSCLTDKNNRRVRSPKNVVDEIKYLQEKYGINCFYFVDELFIDKTNLQWIYDFCDEMKKQKIKILFHAEARVDSISEPVIKALKEVGLDNLFIGFESGNIATLRKYRKGHKPQEAEEALPAKLTELGLEEVPMRAMLTVNPAHRIKMYANLHEGNNLLVILTNQYSDEIVFRIAAVTATLLNYLPEIAQQLYAGYYEGNAQTVYTVLTDYYKDAREARRIAAINNTLNGLETRYANTRKCQLENKVNEVMEYNKKRHAKCFPTRYKVDRNDNSVVLFNRFNKFDLDNEPRLGI